MIIKRYLIKSYDMHSSLLRVINFECDINELGERDNVNINEYIN